MAREAQGRSIRGEWWRRSRRRATAVSRNRALLFLGSTLGVLTGACGSRTLLGEAPGEADGGPCVGAACAAGAQTIGHVWTASSVGFRLEVFNKPGVDAASSICGPATSSFTYVLAQNGVTDRSCYVTAVGVGSFTADAATADAIVAQLEAMRLVDQNMCTADTPTYTFELFENTGANRILQDCAPHALAVPPFIDVDDLAQLDRLLTDAAQRARDGGK